MLDRALVTGASRGIGEAIARELTQSGFDVVGVDVTPSPGVVPCDVSDPSAVAALADDVGPVRVLVNNAAIWRFSPLEDLDPDDVTAVLNVNLAGAFHCTRYFGAQMLAGERGDIVNIGSVAASQPNVGVGAYAASKAGLMALTIQTALEWGPRGIRCNAVAPGFVQTEGTGEMYGDRDHRERRASAVPMGRIGAPEDIASVVGFLVAPASGYVNGEIIHVDGGLGRAAMPLAGRPMQAQT